MGRFRKNQTRNAILVYTYRFSINTNFPSHVKPTLKARRRRFKPSREIQTKQRSLKTSTGNFCLRKEEEIRTVSSDQGPKSTNCRATSQAPTIPSEYLHWAGRGEVKTFNGSTPAAEHSLVSLGFEPF
jgi:hypothetical protein